MLSLALIVIVWAFLRRKQQGLRQWQSTLPLIAAGCCWFWHSEAAVVEAAAAVAVRRQTLAPRRDLHAHGDGHRGRWSFSLEPQRHPHPNCDLAKGL